LEKEDERLEYFAYWEKFTQEQLRVFRKDPTFCKEEQWYRDLRGFLGL
jgi:hypothetical protein